MRLTNPFFDNLVLKVMRSHDYLLLELEIRRDPKKFEEYRRIGNKRAIAPCPHNRFTSTLPLYSVPLCVVLYFQLTFNSLDHHFPDIIDCEHDLRGSHGCWCSDLTGRRLLSFLGRDDVSDEFLLCGCAEFGSSQVDGGIIETGTFGRRRFRIIDGIRFRASFEDVGNLVVAFQGRHDV